MDDKQFQHLREEQKKQEEKILPGKKKAIRCPGCGAALEEEYAFCPSCGHSLKTQKTCPRCGSPLLRENQDICEVCGTWLLEDVCRFCYHPVSKGDSFCPSCGLPVEGLVCHGCGTRHHYHFCPRCLQPQTEFAMEMVRLAETYSIEDKPEISFRNNQEARAFAMAQLYVNGISLEEETPQNTPEADEKAILEQYKAYKKQVEEEEKKSRGRKEALFSDKQLENILERKFEENSSGKEQEEEQEKKYSKEEEERKKEILAHIKKQIRKLKKPRGWICNDCGVFHPAPYYSSACSCASGGGRYVY